MNTACVRTPCKRRIAKRICRRSTFNPSFKIRSASPCPPRAAPICCASSRSSISSSSRTPSTAFSTTSRRWRHWRRTVAWCSTACPRRWRPGLSLGFVVPPLRLRENVMASVRSGGWTASGFAFAAAQQLMADGTAAELARLKRIDAQQRQKIAVGLPFRPRDPDQPQILSSVADVAAALALADLRRRRGAARHRPDAVDDVCRQPRPCAERGTAGAGGASDRTTRSARCARWRAC